MLGDYIVSQKLTRDCETERVKRGGRTASEDSWAARSGQSPSVGEQCPKLTTASYWLGGLAGSCLPQSKVGRSVVQSPEVTTFTQLHHPTHETKFFCPPSGHGLTWPVSSSSCSRHFPCTLHERAWSWHFLRLWSRSPIPTHIASLPSPVSPKSPSVHFVRLLSPSFHVSNTSATHHPPVIASTNNPRLASVLDLFHQESIKIPSRSPLQDLPHCL